MQNQKLKNRFFVISTFLLVVWIFGYFFISGTNKKIRNTQAEIKDLRDRVANISQEISLFLSQKNTLINNY